MVDKSSAGYKLFGAGALAAYNIYNQSRSRTRTITRRRKKSFTMNQGTFVSHARLRTGRKRQRTANKCFRSLVSNGDTVITRWQQTSATYLGPGKVFIGWGLIDANLDRLPIHFISLTSNPKFLDSPAKGCFKGNSMCRVYYNKTTGDYAWASDVFSQDYTGATAATASWQYERDDSGLGGSPLANRCFHKWTDIRLNLYGTYSVPINYEVLVCTMTEENDPLQFLQGVAIPEGASCNNMFKDMTRELLNDTVSVNTSRQQWRKNMRIIKSFKCTIQPLSQSDQVDVPNAAVTSKAPHIKEIKWFIRHDRFRDYKWSRLGTQTTEDRDFTNGGWDYSAPTQPLADVEWGARVFLIIKASCPTRLASDPLYCEPSTLANVNGSYDLSIRNSFAQFQ